MNNPVEFPGEAVEEGPAVPRRPGIATHYLRYSISNGLILLAGFISFPILTRLLDNTQFGLLRYYETAMLLGVAISKLGVPHAIVRFYPYAGGAREFRSFGTNLVLLPLLLSLGLWASGMAGLVAWLWVRGGQLSVLAWCALALVPMLSTISIAQMVIRAGERSDIVMALKVGGRMLELGLVLGAVMLVQASALAVFGGKLLAMALLLAWMLHWLRRSVRASRDAVDWGAVRAGLVFGLPLMANEFAFSMLANLDRVLLKQLTGDFAAVGIYAIGHALAMHLNVFIDATLYEAFTPVVTRTYEAGGNSAVRELKRRVLVPMTYAVVGIVAMLLVSGHDLLVALSGPGKSASGEVFVVVGITISTYSLFSIANYGLQLKHRTMRVLAITLGAALLNIGANFVLIPRIGYMGAAWSCAISYGALCIAQFASCPKGLAQFPAMRATGIALGCAVLLLAVAMGTDLFGLEGAWPRLGAAALLFASVYAGPALALDPALRGTARAMLRRSG